MEHQNYKKNTRNDTIEFSSSKFLNLVFSIGFFHLIYIFLYGFSSTIILSYIYLPLSIIAWICSIIFIYFIFKVLFFEVFSKKIGELTE
ncbi:MAG: hypothetical protein ACJ0DD_01735 [Paracoccaceae bacterium]